MNQNKLYSILVLILLASGCLIYSNSLMDATLLPRVFAVSLMLIIILPIIVFNSSFKRFDIDIIDAAFFTYFLFHLVSVFQAINKPEGFYETGKIFLSFISYLVLKISLKNNLLKENHIYLTFLGIVSLYLCYTISQLNIVSKTASLEGDNLYNVVGIAGNKNLLSGFLMMTAFFLAIYALTATARMKYLSILIIFTIVVLIFLLQGRAVFLATIFSTLFILLSFVLLKGKVSFAFISRFAAGMLLATLIVSAILFLNGTFESFLSRINITNYAKSDTGIERIVVWYKSYFMLKDHWLLGVGARNWVLEFPNYTLQGMFRPMYLNMVFLQPHNDLLWIWCELGILGLFSFLSIFVLCIYYAFKTILSSINKDEKIILLILIGQQIAFLIFCFFDFPKERMEHQLLLSLNLALVSFKCSEKIKTFEVLGNKMKLFFSLSILLIIIYTVSLAFRISGDSLMRPMFAAKERKDNKSIIILAQKMNNVFSNLDPLAVPKKWHEGVAHYESGNYNDAYECFKTARIQAPYNHDVLNNLGGLEAHYKRYDIAIKYLKESLRINRKNDDARFNMAYTFYQLGRYSEAAAVLDEVWANQARKKEFLDIINNAMSEN